MISGEQVVKLKQEQHLQTFLQCLDSCRQFTRGFPGLGRGAACLCGAAGLDVVSAQGCRIFSTELVVLFYISMQYRALDCS